MIRINQIKLPIDHKEEELKKKAAKALRIPVTEIKSLKIIKQSIDARKKEEILYIYSVEVETAREDAVIHKAKNVNVSKADKSDYKFPGNGTEILKQRPVIIGSGPAGLFCGILLARHGYCPVLLERGEDVESRKKSVDAFWKGGSLNLQSNVQFGEGGAGTFSDGKLNTLVKDPLLRGRKVLELFVEFGADPSILYKNKPHIGTDVLSKIVKNIRTEIIRLGGEVRFGSCVTDFRITDGRLKGLIINGTETLDTEAVVLAIGHSARDTFETLLKRQVPMEQKSFAVGLRIQHPQKMINLSQYGTENSSILGAADYKLTYKSSSGRGVYSFCMCPGGYVVNASSEEGRLAVNGMSYHARDGVNSNSALIVTVTPEDFKDSSPLAGVFYQRKLEEAAFASCNGRIPVQLYGDFKEGKLSQGYGNVEPAFEGLYDFGDLRNVLPSYLTEPLIEGIEAFGSRIPGFSHYDAILAGIESRTSSPVRIPRNENMESQITGLYPCGEGAGYAGGITSAAMDGLKCAEAIAKKYKKPSGKN